MKKIKFKKNVVISVGVGVVTFITSVICLSSGCSKKVEKDPDCVQVVTTTTSTTGTTSTCTSTSTTESEITTTSNSTTLTTTTATTDAVVTTKKLAAVSKSSTVKETSTATSNVSTNAATQTAPSTTQQIVEYVVFKPSTHYIHKNTCRWNDDTAYKVDNTNGIEARKCTECNPDMEIVSEYVPPVVESNANSSCWDISGLTIYEGDKTFISICNVVDREYGSTYHGYSNSIVTDYERSQVAMTVLNRYAAGYGNMEYIIYNGYDRWDPCGAYSWSNNYIQRNQPYDTTARAVRMALNAFVSGDNYGGIKSFYGANGYNHFY